MSRALLGLSQILVQLGSLDRAEMNWTKAHDLIEEMELNDSRARMARTRAEILLAQGEQAEGLSQLRVAQEFAMKYKQPREEDLAKRRLQKIQQGPDRK